MRRIAAIGALTSVFAACGAGGASGVQTIAELLAGGEVVFGIFPGEQSAEGGAAMAETSGMDFVFYSLENGPFNLDTYGAYVNAMATALGPDAPQRQMALRIPPVGDEPDAALVRSRQAFEAGVDALVVPHVETAEQAAVAVRAAGSHVNMLIVEDRVGISNVSAIAGTPDVSVVFAGPGDLRRAYEGDMDAVENAIQAVLAACKEHDVPCGITAGIDDIAERIDQGFRVFIVTQREAIAVGKAAAGR